MSESIPVRQDGCPPQVVLEFHAAGDAQSPDIETHIAGCARCQPAVAELRARAETFRRARPGGQFVAKLEQRKPEPRVPWWRWGLAAAAISLGLAVVAAVVRPSPEPGPITLKGVGLSIVAVRAGQDTPELAQSGSSIAAGDVLQFQYVAPSEGHLMIIDLDGLAHLMVFHPFAGTASTPIAAGTRTTLDETVTIDAAPGPERIAAIFRRAPFTVDDVRGWLSTAETTPALKCSDCTVQWVVLEKP